MSSTALRTRVPHLTAKARVSCLMLAAVTAITVAPALAAETAKPNILVIVADDLGYHDVGFHGGKEIPTPHLDKLAQGGTKFSSGYVSCPVCSPTRAGLMTGRYQQRFGHEFNPGQPAGADNTEIGLPLSEVTLADVLQKSGYHTGLVGKWHLGGAPKFQPQERGFDEFFGFLGGAHAYFITGKRPQAPIYRGREEVEEKEYFTNAIAREAASFIDRNAAKPFLLYTTFNAVHTPLDVAPDKEGQFAEIADPKRRKYAAMLSSLDDSVGRILDQLDKSKVADNTLVFFIADNGGPTQANGSLNTPLNGVKATVWEGGIRVPFVVRWPGKVPAGQTYDQPAIALDIYPTALAAAGVATPGDLKLDGVNLLPYLSGENKSAPHETLFWRFGPQHAVRKGNYKLLKLREGGDQLFDLSTDVGESKDLIAQLPDVAKDLQADYDRWNSELVTPKWGPQNAGQKANQPGRPKAKRKAAQAQ